VNPERFDALAKSLGSSTSRRGILKIALAAAAGGLLSGRFGRAQAQSSGRTSVGLTNTSGGPVDVYVTVKGTALDGCVGDVTKIPNWNLVATGSDNLRGKVTLANGQSLPAYDGGSTCFAATISFGSPPLNAQQRIFRARPTWQNSTSMARATTTSTLVRSRAQMRRSSIPSAAVAGGMVSTRFRTTRLAPMGRL
jgi:hypothetical protein